jgi:hypothetical protein
VRFVLSRVKCGEERTRDGDNGGGVYVPAQDTERRRPAPVTAQHLVAVPSVHCALHEVQDEDEVYCRGSTDFF